MFGGVLCLFQLNKHKDKINLGDETNNVQRLETYCRPEGDQRLARGYMQDCDHKPYAKED